MMKLLTAQYVFEKLHKSDLRDHNPALSTIFSEKKRFPVWVRADDSNGCSAATRVGPGGEFAAPQ